MPKPITDIKAVGDDVFKICIICKVNKQVNIDFHYHKTHNYYSRYCKECDYNKRRLKYKNLPIPIEWENINRKPKQKKVFLNKPWRKTHHANRKRLDYRSIDRKKGRINDLTVEFINNALNSGCHYCGFKPTGLDRMDCSIGHLMSNCIPCCYECNIARNSNFTYKEMLEIGKTIRKLKIARGL